MICGYCQENHTTVREVRACSSAPPSEPLQVAPLPPMQDNVIEDEVAAFRRFMGADDEPAKQRGSWKDRTPAEEGFYIMDGKVYKVQIAKHGSGKPYAKLATFEKNYEDKWKVSWEYSPGTVFQLTSDHKMTQEQASAFGTLYGVCIYCGKELTDERSIFAGYGGKCAENQGLPWGATE